MHKAIVAAWLWEERPIYMAVPTLNVTCFCIYGNPSGHVYGNVIFISLMIFYLFKRFKINTIIKTCILIIAFVLTILMCLSRFI